MSGEDLPGHQVRSAADPLAGAMGTLAGLTAAARSGSLDTAVALASLTAARRLAAELERSELALIEAARNDGATWAQVAAAMGTRNRQTAQKRHADLSRRRASPPMARITLQTSEQARQDTPVSISAPAAGTGPREDNQRTVRAQQPGAGQPGVPVTCTDTAPPLRAAPVVPGAAAASSGPVAAPKITPGIIGGGRYELVKAPDHAETRAWHVLVSGKHAGLVRPTWRGERSRPGWEAVDNAGTALPATGTGRVTAGGHARTRDAAAVSLLTALLRQQENERKKATHEPRPPSVDTCRHRPAGNRS